MSSRLRSDNNFKINTTLYIQEGTVEVHSNTQTETGRRVITSLRKVTPKKVKKCQKHLNNIILNISTAHKVRRPTPDARGPRVVRIALRLNTDIHLK